MRLLQILVSFLLVAFGQPSLSPALSILAASFGFALFWQAILSSRRKFLIGTIWFTAVQFIQLNWLASVHYMGPFILVVYVLLSLAIGIQFGLLTSLASLPIRSIHLLGLSSFWVILEWTRLFLFTGFSWNPIGIALSNPYSIQFASLFGIYGLCFWVIFTNLLFLKNKLLWVPVAIFPYFFGLCHQLYWEGERPSARNFSVALVQTALIPEKKESIHPFEQWNRVLGSLKNTGASKFDLIVFPEGAFQKALYPVGGVKAIWGSFGALKDFPPLEEPYRQGKRATNLFWLQSLANHYGAEVIVGLDGEKGRSNFNSAFHLLPNNGAISRYDKQILVPVGEYIPLEFLSGLFRKHFGIQGSFDRGEKTEIFRGALPIGVSICLEETYSRLIQESRVAGAELFVNITNDVWFPNTRLPWHHFDHGRLRAAENGVFNLRACNTGVTGVIDCFGKSLEIFPVSENGGGVLNLESPVYSIPTLYTKIGDWPILLVCGLFSILLLVPYRRKS